jgi:hypothetical protein
VDRALLRHAEADPSSPDAAYFEYDGKPGIDKKDIAEFDKRSKGKLDPPRRAPAKFHGRTVHHRVAPRPSSSPRRPAGAVAVRFADPLEAAEFGMLSPKKSHRS